MEMDVKQLLQPIFKNQFFIEQKLCEKAIKILLKFIENGSAAAASIRERKASEEAGEDQIYNRLNPVEYKFLSLAEVRHNFKSITSHETLLICGELERIGLLEGQLYLGRLKYRFNIDPNIALTGKLFSPPQDVILAAQKRYEEQLNKKLLNAAKTIRRLNPKIHDSPIQGGPLKYAQPAMEIITDKKEIENLQKKTALELHQSKECDPNTCRFCFVEKGA